MPIDDSNNPSVILSEGMRKRIASDGLNEQIIVDHTTIFYDYLLQAALSTQQEIFSYFQSGNEENALKDSRVIDLANRATSYYDANKDSIDLAAWRNGRDMVPYALQCGLFDLADDMLKLGARLPAINGADPIYAIKYLIAKGQEPKSEHLYDALFHQNFGKIRELMRYGVDITARAPTQNMLNSTRNSGTLRSFVERADETELSIADVIDARVADYCRQTGKTHPIAGKDQPLDIGYEILCETGSARMHWNEYSAGCLGRSLTKNEALSFATIGKLTDAFSPDYWRHDSDAALKLLCELPTYMSERIIASQPWIACRAMPAPVIQAGTIDLTPVCQERFVS